LFYHLFSDVLYTACPRPDPLEQTVVIITGQTEALAKSVFLLGTGLD
jgi:hypothetical protein